MQGSIKTSGAQADRNGLAGPRPAPVRSTTRNRPSRRTTNPKGNVPDGLTRHGDGLLSPTAVVRVLILVGPRTAPGPLSVPLAPGRDRSSLSCALCAQYENSRIKTLLISKCLSTFRSFSPGTGKGAEGGHKRRHRYHVGVLVLQ